MAKTVEELTREKEILEQQASAQRTIYENDNRRINALRESLALEEKILNLEDKIYKRGVDGLADQISLQKQIDSLKDNVLGSLNKQLGLDKHILTLEKLKTKGTEEQIKNATKMTETIEKTLDGTLDLEALTRLLGEDFGDMQPVLEKLVEAVRKTPDLSKKAALNKETVDTVDKITGGLYGTAKAIYAATGPMGILLAIATAVANYFIGFAKQALEVRRNLGVSAVDAAKLSFHMEKAAVAAKLQGGDAQKTKDLVTALAEEFGTVQEATSLSAKNTADLATNLASPAGDIAKVLKVMSDLSGESLNTLSSQLEFEASLSKAAGIPMSKVMSQIASNTALFARYGAAGADEMFRAARFAADLGTNLETVEGIADSILDIESSLAAQMEAEMLIGRELNLDRARQLAQQNDLEGLAREIQGLVGGPEAFANLGRIEQNALANALGGISIQQLTPFMAGNTAGGTNQAEQEQIGTAKDQLSAQNQTNKILNEKLDLLIEATDKNTKEQRRSR